MMSFASRCWRRGLAWQRRSNILQKNDSAPLAVELFILMRVEIDRQWLYFDWITTELYQSHRSLMIISHYVNWPTLFLFVRSVVSAPQLHQTPQTKQRRLTRCVSMTFCCKRKAFLFLSKTLRKYNCNLLAFPLNVAKPKSRHYRKKITPHENSRGTLCFSLFPYVFWQKMLFCFFLWLVLKKQFFLPPMRHFHWSRRASTDV